MNSSQATKSTSRVETRRKRQRESGGGRFDAQLSQAGMSALIELSKRVGLSRSDVTDAALIFLLESMNNGLIMKSELDNAE